MYNKYLILSNNNKLLTFNYLYKFVNFQSNKLSNLFSYKLTVVRLYFTYRTLKNY